MNTMYDIFLADDHTIIRHGLRHIIEENPGYRIVGETDDGLEVISKIRTLHPNMIILDLSMPDLNGIEVVNRIRKYNKKVADRLGISVRTAEHHRLNIMKKLSVTNTAGLVRYALRTKVID